MNIDCYSYHIRITDRESVRVEKRDPDNNIIGEPSGRFDYTGETKVRIQNLHQAACSGELLESEVRELGERLFLVLFDETLRRDFFDLYQKVLDEEVLLRLELDVDENQLFDIAALPWEFMHVPVEIGYGNVWLGTNPNLVFSRRRVRWIAPKPVLLKTNERLRIAVAVAAPGDLGPVKYETLWEDIKKLVTKKPEQFELLPLINPATTKTIDAILQQKPHIFHFIGHARLKDENQRDTGQIALVDEMFDETPVWIGAERFGELFNRHRPSIILLQACEGAAISASNAFVGVASQIIEQNIPVTVAMQYQISNATARRFVSEFYRQLSENIPVDKAVQESRREVALALGYKARDFATPVLFMRVHNGQLFQYKIQDAQLAEHEKVKQETNLMEEMAQKLTFIVEVATGSTENLEKQINFVKLTQWYDGDIEKFQRKMFSVKHFTGYELLRKYFANDRMQINIAGRVIPFPQELITGDIQGKFEDVFVKFDRNTCYNPEPFRYKADYEKICLELEEKQKLIFKRAGRKLFNGLNLRLSDLQFISENDRLRIKTIHQPVYYYNALGTHYYSLDEPIYDSTITLRDLVYQEGRLCPFTKSIMANAVGINLLIISRDNQIIFQQRSENTLVRPSEACSSVSGEVDDDDADTTMYHPLLKALHREALEEIGLEKKQLGDIFFLGAVREFLRAEKPDFFFASKVNLSHAEIVKIAKCSGKNVDRWEWEDLPELNILPDPLPQTQNNVKTLEYYLQKYLHLLLKLEQPPSLPLLTNMVLLAKFQTNNPNIL